MRDFCGFENIPFSLDPDDIERHGMTMKIEYTDQNSEIFQRFKMKRVKRIFRRWYDITYQTCKQAFKDRLNRDMKELEENIGPFSE